MTLLFKHLNIASKQIVLSLCQMESFGKRKWRLKIQKAAAYLAAFLHLPSVFYNLHVNQGMYKHRVENNGNFFEIPALLSCERGNPEEGNAK